MNTNENTPSRFQLPAPAVDELRNALVPAFGAVAPPPPPTPRPEYTTSRVRFGDPRDGHFVEANGSGSFASLGALLDAAGVAFDVEAVPVHDPEGRTVDGHRISRRRDTGEAFGIVSDRYAPIAPADAFGALLGPAIAAGVARPTRAGHIVGKSFAQCSLALSDAEVLPGDTVRPLLSAVHSYDAKSATRGGFTATRIVCRNTLLHAWKDLGDAGLTIRKRGDADAVRARMHEAGRVLNTIADVYATTVASWRFMAGRNASDQDLRDLIARCFQLAGDKAGKAKLDKLHAEIRRTREGGRGSQIRGVQGSTWGAYNAISEYWEHEQTVRAGDLSEGDRRTARAMLEPAGASFLERLQLEALRCAGVPEPVALGSMRGDRKAWGLAPDWRP
jgi:hypothetical protein